MGFKPFLATKSVLVSIALSSLFFEILHLLGRIISTSILGALMAVFYLKYENIAVPIAMHIRENTLGSIIGAYIGVDRLIDWSSSFFSDPNGRIIILIITVITYAAELGVLIDLIRRNWPNIKDKNFDGENLEVFIYDKGIQ